MHRLLLLLTMHLLLHANTLPLYFRGNKSITSETLYTMLGLSMPPFYLFWKDHIPKIDPQKAHTIPNAINTYYKQHGFYHTRTLLTTTQQAIIVTIQEGPPISIADLKTISLIAIDNQIPFREGDRFDASAFIESKKSIRATYHAKGYCNAKLNAKAYIDIEKNLAYLIYEVTPNQPCYFDTITIHTPPSIDPRLIAAQLPIDQNSPYNPQKIHQAYERLYAFEGIERVRIDYHPHQGNRVPIDLTIEPYRQSLRLAGGLGYSTDQGIGWHATLKDRNFLGNLKTAGVFLQYTTRNHQAELMLKAPLFSGAILDSKANFQSNRFDGFRERHQSFQLQYLIQNHTTHRYLGVRLQKSRTDHSRNTREFPKQTTTLFRLQGGATIDTRNTPVDPTSGYRFGIECDGALRSLFSDADYLRLLLLSAYDHPLKIGTLSMRLRLGSLKIFSGSIPPSLRFFAGGIHSNRGWRYRQLGPTDSYNKPIGAYGIAEGGIEVRIGWRKQWRWVLFTDWTTMSQHPYPTLQDPYGAIGVGLRYLSPIGPIGIDGAVALNHHHGLLIHFHIGELF